MLKPDVNPYFSNFAISFIGYFSKAIYNSFKIIGLYHNCHITYLFKHVYQCDQQFRLRIAYNQTRTMSQIDGNLWLQFIARGTLDNGSSTAAQFPVSSQKPCNYRHIR
jgi:hypothetical protein